MGELRPPTRYDLRPFDDKNDMREFSDLIEKDQAWLHLYSSEYESLEEQETAEQERRLAEFLAKPEAPDHIMGYVYHWEAAENTWVSLGQLNNTFAGFGGYQALPQAAQTLYGILEELTGRGTLQVGGYQAYKLGDNAPIDKFPQLDETFDEWVYGFLRTHRMSCPAGAICLEYCREDLSPFTYWASRRRLFELVMQGKLAIDNLRFFELPASKRPPEEPKDPQSEELLDSIDDQLGQQAELADRSRHATLSADAELRIRQLALGARMGKPRQRTPTNRLNRRLGQ
jgi:hypothetical protein